MMNLNCDEGAVDGNYPKAYHYGDSNNKPLQIIAELMNS